MTHKFQYIYLLTARFIHSNFHEHQIVSIEPLYDSVSENFVVRHMNMRDHPHYRTRRPRQTSSFLKLPAEIRNQIYQVALISPKPVDLWPVAKCWRPDLLDPPDTAMQHRYAKSLLAQESQYQNLLPRHDPESIVGFRLQADLLFVRKELSTGLLGTCVQVYNEAANYFWRSNTWRFSDDDDWRGVYRFLLTIGPRARSRIQRLDILAPFTYRPDTDDLFNKRLKNHPKMHMAKLWHDDSPLGQTRRDQVYALMMEEKTLHSLHLLAPAQFKIENLSDNDCSWPGFLPLNFMPEIKVVIEAGARVDDTSLEYIHGQGWESLCLPGSKVQTHLQGGILVSREVPAGEPEKRSPRFDYLSGLSLLFEEEEELSIHANGGRVKQFVKEVKVERALEAFGPCMIIRLEIKGCGSWWWLRSWERYCYKSLVDVHEQILLDWWTELEV